MESPESITLTNEQLGRIHAGLTALDGLRTKPDEFRPYRFDDENETIWLIAENTSVIEPHIKVFNAAKKMLASQRQIVEGMQISKDNQEQVGKFMSDLDDLQQRPIEVKGLKKISRARLKVGHGEKKNPIPSSVLAMLMPILDQG